MKNKDKQSKKIRISKGYKKYLRSEKARIRKEVLDVNEQEKLIEDLYNNLHKK